MLSRRAGQADQQQQHKKKQLTLNLRTTSLRGRTGVALRAGPTAARLATTLLLASIILAVLSSCRARLTTRVKAVAASESWIKYEVCLTLKIS
jgi:hypothetical protein